MRCWHFCNPSEAISNEAINNCLNTFSLNVFLRLSLIGVFSRPNRRLYSTIGRQSSTPETFFQCYLSRAFKTSRTSATQAAKPGYPVRSNSKTRREQKSSHTRTFYASIYWGIGFKRFAIRSPTLRFRSVAIFVAAPSLLMIWQISEFQRSASPAT